MKGADEAYEMSYSAQAARQRRDRNRRASWARRMATDQRVEAKRGGGTRSAPITDRIRAIPIANRTAGVRDRGLAAGAPAW